MWEQELFVWAFWDAINRWVRRSWRSAVAGTGDPQISNFHRSNMLHNVSKHSTGARHAERRDLKEETGWFGGRRKGRV